MTNKKKQPTQTHQEWIDQLSPYETFRWAALIDAIELIANKCEEKKIDFETADVIKPLDIQKFLDAHSDNLGAQYLNIK